MAGKPKKKPTKKTAKKPAPKKASAKGSAKKKAAPKKAAPKKAAAAKKAAPKAKAKAAPKKKPATLKPAAKRAPKPAEVEEVEVDVDFGPEGDVQAAEPSEKASLQAEILAMARELYGPDRSDDELLALDPNDVDAMDPSMFYELLGEKYGVAADPDNDYFGGFGGPIKKTIAFVESRWDGSTRKDTPMPPGDWLETYVHPAGGTETTS